MPLQRANGRGRWKIPTRAGWREVKRRERRAPVLERDLQVASACEVRTALDYLGRVGLAKVEAA
jgi:hypothetical protein